jgi:BMFP domain-containing protein YqiC
MPRLSWALRHRLDAAEAAVDARWVENAAGVLGEAMRAAPREVQIAVTERLRDLQQRGALSGDVVEIALREIAEVAPEVAARVRSRLGIGNDRGSP